MLPKQLWQRTRQYLKSAREFEPFELALFPLNTVLFPGGVLPLRVFEPRYMEMAKTCMRDSKPFGVCLIQEGEETGTPAVPHNVGCMVNIVDFDMTQIGMLNLKTVGTHRFSVLETREDAQGLILGQVTQIPDEAMAGLPAKHQACAMVLQHIIEQAGEHEFEKPLRYDDAVWVSYRLAEILPIKLIAKQHMLEMNDTSVRIEVLHKFLAQQGLVS